MEEHIRATHSGEKPHTCAHCDKKFYKLSNLRRHERLHMQLQPYRCSWPGCASKYSNRSDILRHIRAVHFGLPRVSAAQQPEQDLLDGRDPKVFMEVVTLTKDPDDRRTNAASQYIQKIDDDEEEEDGEEYPDYEEGQILANGGYCRDNRNGGDENRDLQANQ